MYLLTQTMCLAHCSLTAELTAGRIGKQALDMLTQRPEGHPRSHLWPLLSCMHGFCFASPKGFSTFLLGAKQRCLGIHSALAQTVQWHSLPLKLTQISS